jgi:hypothetical protein
MDMRQIRFERQRGFMGRKVFLNLDLYGLPTEEARKMELLISNAHLFSLPSEPGITPNPEAYIYTLEINFEGRQHTIHTTDGAAPDNLRPLLVELTRLAQAQIG